MSVVRFRPKAPLTEYINCGEFLFENALFIFIPFWVIDHKIEDFQKNFFDKKNKNYESASWLNIVKFLIREKNFSELEIALDSRTWKNMLKAKYLK